MTAERARIHIAGYGMSDRIETRLSDGLAAVKPKEVEEMIVAGMGGGLVIHILEEGKQIVSTLKGCILQPQSEIQKVREHLCRNMGFCSSRRYGRGRREILSYDAGGTTRIL